MTKTYLRRGAAGWVCCALASTLAPLIAFASCSGDAAVASPDAGALADTGTSARGDGGPIAVGPGEEAGAPTIPPRDGGPPEANPPDAEAPDSRPMPSDATAPAAMPWLSFLSNRDGVSRLYRAHFDGTGVEPLTSSTDPEALPSWSADGSKVVVSRQHLGTYGLVVVDVAQRTEVELTTGLANATSPSFSPDGSELVFEGRTAEGGPTDIYRMPAAGGVPTRLTDDPKDDSAPLWTHDGSTLFFVSQRSGVREVWAMAPDGTGVRQVTKGANFQGRPAISRDARYLAFAQVQSTQTTALVVVDLQTQVLWRPSVLDDSEPAFSPDNTVLVATTLRWGDPEVVLVDSADGAHTRRVTFDTGVDGQPAFVPLGAGFAVDSGAPLDATAD